MTMQQPKQINYRDWHFNFKEVPDELVETTRYYRHLPDAEWSQYLFPPSTHVIQGNRLLRKLKFDNSQASLRLWGFALAEGERIYRARQADMKVIGVMGDLGAVTPLVFSFPDTTAFYPDCLWWTPFLMESRVLFEEAGKLGMGDDCCFVRASLGAFSKKAYFPRADLFVGTVGATCDDMATVMSGAEYLGSDVFYFELPHRDDSETDQRALTAFLADQFRSLCSHLETSTGNKFSEDRFFETIRKINRLRSLIAEIKLLSSQGDANPMGAVELMNVEFSALAYYADLDECIDVIQEFRDCVKSRVDANRGYDNQDLRLVWVTPPADPILMNYMEDLGCRIVGSEYLINQTTPHYAEDGDPFEILASSHLHGSLMGSSEYRVKLVLDQVKQTGADGAIISGIFGSTHCPYETQPIVDALRTEGFPVLAFDVVAPGKVRLQSQIFNRMEAFVESLTARKRRHAG